MIFFKRCFCEKKTKILYWIKSSCENCPNLLCPFQDVATKTSIDSVKKHSTDKIVNNLLNNLFIYADILQNKQEKELTQCKKKKKLFSSTPLTNPEIQRTTTITRLLVWKVEKLAWEAWESVGHVEDKSVVSDFQVPQRQTNGRRHWEETTLGNGKCTTVVLEHPQVST